MLAKTHSKFGISFGLTSLYLVNSLSVSLFNPVLSIVFIYYAYKGSLIPDIDHRGSTMGRRYPILSFIVSKLFGHRKFTHSVFFIVPLTVVHIVIVYGFLKIIERLANDYVGFSVFAYLKETPLVISLFLSFGLLLGMFSHIIGDSLTKQGVLILTPISKKRFKLPFGFTTGGKVEKVLAYCFLILNTVFLIVIVFSYGKAAQDFRVIMNLIDKFSETVALFK